MAEIFHDIKKDTIVLFCYQVNEAFCCTKGLVRDEKLREVLSSYFFLWRITLILSRISSEPLMSISCKHNYKTFSEGPPASLLHFIGNVLSHSSGKLHDYLTMAALSFTFTRYLLISP